MRILFADNDRDFLTTRTDYLQRAGHQVIKANSLGEARLALADQYVHLAILDVRLIDDNDAKDTSGLILARDPQFRAVPKIMLTDYPHYMHVREAMGAGYGGVAAINYLAKAEGPNALIQAVDEVFTHHLRVNRSLVFRWHPKAAISSFAHLVTLTEPELPPGLLAERILECDDLWRRLFFDHEQVTMISLLWMKDTRAAFGTLAHAQGRGTQLLVIFQPAACDPTLATNQLAAGLVAAPGLGPPMAAQTVHYVLMAWPVNRTELNLEEAQPLVSFCQEKPDRLVKTALEALFENGLAPWYQQGRTVLSDRELLAFLQHQAGISAAQMPAIELRRRLEALTTAFLEAALPVQLTYAADRVGIRFPSGRTLNLADPLPALYQDRPLPTSPCVISPGSLNDRTVLVQRDNKAWPGDFTHPRSVPIWHDFVTLETGLRFDLATVDDVEDLLDFEQKLLAIQRLSDSIVLESVETSYRKVCSAIQTVRRLSAAAAGDELYRYLLCLFYATAAGLVSYDPALHYTRTEMTQLFHRFLLIAMLGERISQLEQATHPEPPPTVTDRRLRIDETNHRVWLGSRPIELSPTEFDLLAYLLHRAGQLCRRSDIVRDVFQLKNATHQQEDSLLNTNIARLREKIEADTDSPEYVITIRGQGYRLESDPAHDRAV